MRHRIFGASRTARAVAVGLVGILAATVASGFSHQGSERVTLSPDEDTVAHAEAREYLFDHLRDRAAGDGVWLSTRLRDQLPNHLYAIDGAKAQPISSGLVIGEVVAAEKGSGYALEGVDAAAGTATDFDAEDALWRVVEIRLNVESGFGVASNLETVTVGLPVSGGTDPGLLLEGLRGERVVVFYEAPGRFTHDPSLSAVSEHGGSLIGFVDAEGGVDFPSLSEDLDNYVGDLAATESIVAAASQPITTTQVSMVQGLPVVRD